ncbi:hypothetical protein WDW86_01535 [Bdellovibrionota bacterium FG-2]
MKISKLILATVLLGVVGLTGCNDLQLDRYVEQVVDLKFAKTTEASFQGVLSFMETTYFTSYRRVCSTAVCGYDWDYRCYYETRCDSVVDVQVSDAGGNERPREYERGGGHPGEGHHGGGHPGEGHPSCHSHQVCQNVMVPRYCEVDCHDVPYQDSSDQYFPSRVFVKLEGISAAEVGTVNELQFGANTNASFHADVHNAQKLPKKLRASFADLSIADQTLLVMKAKGFKMVSDTGFLKLPADFKRGDDVSITIQVEKTGNSDVVVSSMGTTAELPVLHTSVNQ